MRIKIAMMAAGVLLLSGSRCFAFDRYDVFSQYVNRSNLKPFARDLGGILGSASFHSGRSLGITAFDLGVHAGMQFKPAKDDSILRNAGVGVFGLPWVQAEIGLPFRLDGFIRGISFQGLTVAGGGLRYGLFKVSDVPWTPQVLVSGVGHVVTHDDFSATHVGLDLVASMSAPIVSPYVGVGFDRTRVVVHQANLSATDPTIVGTAATTTESRFTAGLNFRPIPFGYVMAAATLTHGQAGSDVGLGIRF